jgi:uncharacterized low-complexity protein
MFTQKILSVALGTVFAAGLALSNAAVASNNPFAAQNAQGVQLAADTKDAAKEGATEEGKCGGDKAKKDGKCGGDKAKKDGKCGAGKCGGDKAKKDGKCGEGKCGGDKKKDEKKDDAKCGGK